MDVTAQLEEQKSQYPSIQVEKLVPLEYDFAHLCAFDNNSLDFSKLNGSNTNEYLLESTREGAQLLLNELFNLPTSVDPDVGVMVELPEPNRILPREKPLPKPKPPTKWERFAKEKGIQKRKKTRMVFDDAAGEYRPRWGYGSAQNDSMKNWVIEVPKNADPMEDQYAKQREAKAERVSKNKKQQLRNQSEATAKATGQDPRVLRKKELEAKIIASKKATASAGVFDKKLDGDLKIKGVKRKFDNMVGDVNKEKSQALNLVDKIMKKEPVVNVAKITNQHIRSEQKQKAKEKAQRIMSEMQSKKRKSKK
ncbi:ribosome biogenesis regulatory protein-domain-containing protein [Paraphysoderma sedebokerense]|nr:ribosome biogenesis regulatory protein-domain-containing protein [Paraphysoderma sedebokerense]